MKLILVIMILVAHGTNLLGFPTALAQNIPANPFPSPELPSPSTIPDSTPPSDIPDEAPIGAVLGGTLLIQGGASIALVRDGNKTMVLKIGDLYAASWRLKKINRDSVLLSSQTELGLETTVLLGEQMP
ncbi:MAG: hypothetical protein DBW67_01805 [SAR116 cluster bacterium]|nr:hypothetical protein [Paracoccaceae bacterium]RCL81198.1 MAG: hypothetical protein DBW67_01805 [SAR116 cluster bacterium]RPH14315.1 MAG: hypothetical protein CBD10_000340 [Alphaproteobacteria bacterium TMED150]HCZ02525.1 hypothetical protein [Verrucomicrobiales bacterium]|tara:strand:+ start:10893 stop:11279 length:387 start_codon:yes stop_codon:yes gene_type:complete